MVAIHATRRLWLMLLAAYACVFIGPFGGNMIISMFPVLEHWFNVDVAIMSLTITFFMIPYSVTHIFGGSLSDAYGRSRVMSLGLAIYGLGSFIAAFSPTIEVLLISRVIQGVGGAMLAPTAMALLGDMIHPKDLGKAMGGYSMAVTAGIATGPLIGGVLASINWTYAFILLGALSLALMTLTMKVRGKKSSGRNLKTAWIGFLKALRNLVIFLAGIIGFITFVIRIGIYTYAADALGKPPYQLSTDYIGFLLSLAGFAGLAAGLLAGYLTDRLGRIPTAFIGTCFLFLTLIMLALPIWASLMPFIMLSLGFGGTMLFTPLGTMTVERLPQARGAAASVYGFLRFAGYALGPIILLAPYTLFGVEGVALSCIVLIMVSLLALLIMRRNL
ncbi:MAG: MFS transporter [Candidatus Nezhaarchaeales archaeon]